MHSPLVLGAGAAAATLALLFAMGAPGAAQPAPLQPPVADGHFVLVVEGDRNGLAITSANAKADPWAGVRQGLASDWRLTIHDERGQVLAAVPLDVTPFAVGANEQGRPVRVEGCVVRASRIGMLVNVPRFAAAANYVFARRGADGAWLPIGTTTGDEVRRLATGGR